MNTTNLKFAIFGVGGTGGVIGGYLANAGNDVTFLARGAHLAAMQKDGLTIHTNHRGDIRIKPCQAMLADDYHDTPDVLFICVKYYGLDAAIALTRRIAGPDTLVIPILNVFGTGAVMQEKFSAPRCLATLAAGGTPCLVAVPSQLLLMLQWAEHRKLAPIPQVELITISGARWMRAHTPALRKLFPKARIIEFYGASEASFVAWMDADDAISPQAVGRPFSNVDIDIRPTMDQSVAEPDRSHASDGLIYIRSPMLFMDYVGDAHDPTAVLRDGDWLSVRDMGHIDERGMLCLAGRQSRMIVTQGKNLFPEEVENLLTEHPQIAQASLQGQADALRGMQVHGIVQWNQEQPLHAMDALALTQWVRERSEAFKAPRQWWICTDWPMTASGKTDHAKLGLALQAALSGQNNSGDLPVLRAWQG